MTAQQGAKQKQSQSKAAKGKCQARDPAAGKIILGKKIFC